jgi:hypothetical protein
LELLRVCAALRAMADAVLGDAISEETSFIAEDVTSIMKEARRRPRRASCAVAPPLFAR